MESPVKPKRVTLTVKQAEVRREARGLLRQHGLSSWRFSFDRARTRFGMCNYSTQTISLSRHWTEVRPVEDSRITILHEIAHAMVGPAHGHDGVWKAQARALGLTNPAPCTSAGEHTIGEALWVGLCKPGHRMEQHRAPKRVSSCGLCGKKFNLANLIEWKRRGKVVKMSPAYERELSSLRRKHAQ